MTDTQTQHGRASLEVAQTPRPLERLVVDARSFAYQDVGTGPAVILAHGSGASHKIWATLVTTLNRSYRVIAPDLLGYGRSEPWPANARLHPWSDLGVLLALAARVREPVHLVGHSYGGTVALEAARVLGPRILSLTLIEPVAFHLLRLTGRTREWREINQIGESMTMALRGRRDRSAAHLYVKYWVGRMRWWTMSPSARRRLAQTVGKVRAEFEVVAQLSRCVGDYRAIMAPTRLIAGQRTPAAARAIVDELSHILPNAHVRVVARAGHMSPHTHPREIASLVAEHIASIDVNGDAAPLPRELHEQRRSIA